jgi:hypothetical protein
MTTTAPRLLSEALQVEGLHVEPRGRDTDCVIAHLVGGR